MTVAKEANGRSRPTNQLQSYYASIESRAGYEFFLGGRRHFGYYTSGTKWPFPIGKALLRMEDNLFDSLAVAKGSRVLDAGCGAGYVALNMARRGLKVQGIDIVQNHVNWTRQLVESQGFGSAVDASLMDYHDLSAFPDASFDAIYSSETIVHATDLEQVFSEFYRILKPGGRIAMNEYEHMDLDKAKRNFPKHSRDLINDMKRINIDASMPANDVFVDGEMQQILQKKGFAKITVTDLSDNVLPMVRFFYLIAYVPWMIVCLLGLQTSFVNTRAGYAGYPLLKMRIQSYKNFTAMKPL